MTTNYDGLFVESWNCIDCGRNTAPGLLNKSDAEKLTEANGGSFPDTQMTIDDQSEVYCVRDIIWKKARMVARIDNDYESGNLPGGCLCIKCLEERIGRQLKPKDFLRGHPFNRPDITWNSSTTKSKRRNTEADAD